MNITSADGKWRITQGFITNRETNETRSLSETPSANTIAFMNYETFLRKCAIAFDTGVWPKTYWSSGRVSD